MCQVSLTGLCAPVKHFSASPSQALPVPHKAWLLTSGAGFLPQSPGFLSLCCCAVGEFTPQLLGLMFLPSLPQHSFYISTFRNLDCSQPNSSTMSPTHLTFLNNILLKGVILKATPDSDADDVCPASGDCSTRRPRHLGLELKW